MVEILEGLKDDLIPLNHQTTAKSYLFINEDDPTLNEFTGEYESDVPWNWDDFFKYLSLAGLQNSSAFYLEIGALNSQEDITQGIDNETVEVKNFIKYAVTIGTNMFKKECDE